MAINTTPDNLRMEAEAAIKLRRRHTDLSKMLIERYCGSAYRDDWAPETPSHENHEFEFVTNILPALVANNPKVNVKSRRPVVHRELSESMQHGLNRWVADIDMQYRLESPIEDAQFDFGVVAISLESLPGYDEQDDPPLRPTFHRISPRRYFKDPQGGVSGGRYAGQIIVRDREDMLAQRNPDGTPTFDREAVEGLSSPDGADAVLDDALYHDMEIRVDRNQVVYAEMYLRETREIHTIGFSSVPGENGTKKGAQLRKPRRFYGGPMGPYIELGFYAVPDQVYPLPPLAATHDLVDEINAHAEQVSRDSDSARNLLLYDSTNAALGDAVTNAANGSVMGIPGFDSRAFAEVNLGGANPVQLDYIQRLRERIDRRSGLTDIQRGNITGEATATEAQLAAAAASGRVKFMQRKVNQFVTKLLHAAGWLMFHSSSVVFPISLEEAEGLVFNGFDATARGESVFGARPKGAKEGMFYGGVQEGQDETSYYDLEIKIEAYSMEQVTEAILQKRMMEAFSMVVKVGELIPRMPFINWPDLMDDYFQTINVPDGRKYINFELLAQMLGMQFQMGQVQTIPGLAGPGGQGGAANAPGSGPMPGANAGVGEGVSEMAAMLGSVGRAA